MSSTAEPAVLTHLRAAVAEVTDSGPNIDSEVRNKTLNEAKKLVASLEMPFEKLWHFSFSLGTQRMAMRVALDMGLYGALVKADGKPVEAKQLADACKAEKLFTVRITRVLAAIGFVDEVGLETYAANDLTRLMAEETINGVVKATYDIPGRVQSVMHSYFRERGFKSPVDSLDCPLQWTLNTKKPYFGVVQEDPELFKAFTQLMVRWRGLSKHWTDWYPVKDNLLKDANVDDTILVDMGGDRGHDLEIFLKHFPETHGRLVLQDLPMTIDTVGHLAPAIKPTVHDFFTEQPVKGARAYFMHIVMHDWPDDTVRKILRQIMPAMRPGYSKILLNEIVLPDQNCPAGFAASDINMMSALAGMERSRSHWIELVESVGLKIVAVHTSPYIEDSEGVVEAMLEA